MTYEELYKKYQALPNRPYLDSPQLSLLDISSTVVSKANLLVKRFQEESVETIVIKYFTREDCKVK